MQFLQRDESVVFSCHVTIDFPLFNVLLLTSLFAVQGDALLHHSGGSSAHVVPVGLSAMSTSAFLSPSFWGFMGY